MVPAGTVAHWIRRVRHHYRRTGQPFPEDLDWDGLNDLYMRFHRHQRRPPAPYDAAFETNLLPPPARPTAEVQPAVRSGLRDERAPPARPTAE
eukprot:8485444-Alexandrium_andersonii.AAC.1